MSKIDHKTKANPAKRPCLGNCILAVFFSEKKWFQVMQTLILCVFLF